MWAVRILCRKDRAALGIFLVFWAGVLVCVLLISTDISKTHTNTPADS